MWGEHLLEELDRFDGDAEILQAWRDGMMPEPTLLVSEWADRHRILGSRSAAEPGPWRTARTPYLREIMDALSPSHPARRVVFMKGAQVGGTECGNNWIGYVIHHAPGPMLAVQPTTELAKRFSDQRIDPLVEETPAIREGAAPARSRTEHPRHHDGWNDARAHDLAHANAHRLLRRADGALHQRRGREHRRCDARRGRAGRRCHSQGRPFDRSRPGRPAGVGADHDRPRRQRPPPRLILGHRAAFWPRRHVPGTQCASAQGARLGTCRRGLSYVQSATDARVLRDRFQKLRGVPPHVVHRTRNRPGTQHGVASAEVVEIPVSAGV
jgi:hypothetical protein